jgi:hypothetical protein
MSGMTSDPAGKIDRLPSFGGAAPRVRVFQLPRPAIQYLVSLCEASDGIGLVRTLDESRGVIECWIMPDFEDDFERLLAAVGRQWPIQPLDREFE